MSYRQPEEPAPDPVNTPRSVRSHWRSVLVPYGVSILVIVLATLLRYALVPAIGPTTTPFVTYFPAIVLIAWRGGLGPGLFGVLLGAACVDFFFTEPLLQFGIADVRNVWSHVVFLATGTGISLMGEAQRQASLQAQQAANLLGTTLRSIGDGVVVTDCEGKITLLNPVAEQMTGWPDAEARGKPHTVVFQISNEDTGDPVESPVDRVLREGVVVGLANHTVLRSRDGTARPIADSGAPIRDGDGPVHGAVLVFRDVSEQSHREKRDRFFLQLNERTRVLTDPDAILDTTLEAVSAYLGVSRCLYGELAEAQAAGVILREYSRNAPPIVGPRDLTPWAPLVDAVRQGQVVQNSDTRTDPRTAETYESRLAPRAIRAFLMVPYLRDGYAVSVLTVTSETPREWRKEDVALLADVLKAVWLMVENARLYRAARDEVAERRRAEAERERYLSEVQALNERLRRSMSETHHRVKNNLQVISALVGMHMMEGETSVPVVELQRLNQHIRALAAIHDILTIQARGDGGAETISVAETLSKLQPMIQGMVEGRQIRFTADDCRLPVRQGTTLAVLVNELVANAIKHGAGDIEVTFSVAADTGYLTVRDHGPGFPPDFDPQTASHTGLELVNNLVEWDLQGEIRYENENGARVCVSLPLTP